MTGPLEASNIGQVISVRGSAARIGLFDATAITKAEARTTVGGFITIQNPRTSIIAMITEASCEKAPAGYAAVLSVDLLGEIYQGQSGKRFHPWRSLDGHA